MVFLLPLQPKKKKNITHDVFGTQHGRVHMESQDLADLQTRKMKALKRKGKVEEDADAEKEKKDSGGRSVKKAKTGAGSEGEDQEEGSGGEGQEEET